jgi:hypothetical protein
LRAFFSGEIEMWKIFVGFVIFAALALFVIMKGGDKLDMGGEKHGEEAVHAPAISPASAPVQTPVAPASSAK